MSNRRSLKDIFHHRTVKNSRSLTLRKLSAYVGLCLGAAILAIAVLILVFGGAILNHYGKQKAERAFAKAHPGYVLQIGKLDYAWGANRLIAQSVTLSTSNSTIQAGRISLTGVRWVRFLWGKAALAEVLAKAGLDAANLEVEFPQAHYGIRCERLQVSVPDSVLLVEGTELKSLIEDEAFFAAYAFRATRFHVVVPECRVLGLAYGELLQGKSYQARSVHFSLPSLDALVDRYKPFEPFVKSPLMVHEALAAIPKPLQIDSLSITDGYLKYSEQVVAGADPGVLTFTAVNMSIKGIANRGEDSTAILIQGQGKLMDAGVLKVQMTIPVTSPDLSYHYSGSLSPMDLTPINAFIANAEQTRIKSGWAKEAAFDIDVTAGYARGHVRAIYRNLEIAMLDIQTSSAKGMANRFSSFLANLLKIRSSNAPDASGSMKEGVVNYARKPDEEFIQFSWFALRSGVLDIISH
jgi:hypothetical protein